MGSGNFACLSWDTLGSEFALPDDSLACRADGSYFATTEQVPIQTLAGQTSRTKLIAFQRDFEPVAAAIAGTTRANTLIAAAQQYAFAADEAAQNSRHTASQWQEIAGLWQEAIARLQKVGEDDPGYIDAQKLLVNYQTNLGKVRSRLQTE